jgi:hypothetical protein
MPIAADLSALLLTKPGAAAAFPQEVQVSTAQGQASVKFLLFAAATTLHAMASLLASEGTKVMGPQHTILPPALVADSVQRAVVLHLAACMPYCMEQLGKQPGNHGASSSGGGKNAAVAFAADTDTVPALCSLWLSTGVGGVTPLMGVGFSPP